MVDGERPSDNIGQQIFDSFFRESLSPADFDRASAIYREVSPYNERSIAIQFFTAQHAGKLEEVLDAYERLLAEDSFLHRVPDQVTRAVEIRIFGDVVYGSVIAEGDMMRLLELRQGMEIPKAFDLMSE